MFKEYGAKEEQDGFYRFVLKHGAGFGHSAMVFIMAKDYYPYIRVMLPVAPVKLFNAAKVMKVASTWTTGVVRMGDTYYFIGDVDLSAPGVESIKRKISSVVAVADQCAKKLGYIDLYRP